MKKLKKWLESNEISQNEFAKKIGIPKSTMSRYINGQRTMPVSIAVKIEKATKGKVTCQDLA